MPDPSLLIADARRLLDSGDPAAAIDALRPLTADPDGAVAGEAWLLTGTAHYRADDEPAALHAWRRAAAIGWAGAWIGSRSVAEQLVRDGDLEGAIEAYREADRRAPAGERGAIANRIAWLLKETGHDFAARRQFNRARGAYATHTGYVTYAIIAACAIVFVAELATAGPEALRDPLFGFPPSPVIEAGVVNGFAVANGEWWRIVTSIFIHLNGIHILMNMYVLYLYGQVVEQMYGRFEYLAIYLLCGIGGSVLTILIDPGQSAGGASGAIFGVIGLLFAATRRHHAVLGREARMVVAGIGTYIVLLLVFTFAVPGISWTGHLGGLVVGAILGFLLPPTGVETLSGMWRSPTGERLRGKMPLALRAAIYGLVVAMLAVGGFFAVQRLVG
jgi:membrane associated rhomboid family serine protease